MYKDDQCNVPENKDSTTQDAIIIIDMNKLPEEIREKFPKDLQDKLMELLQNQLKVDQSQIDKQNKNIQDKTAQNKPDSKYSNFFAIQQGYVSGNIYKDGIFPEEKPIQKSKMQIIDR
jgi:hypothetical protein